MEKLDCCLERWRTTEAEHVPIRQVKRDPALQPRADELVPEKEHIRRAKDSQRHTEILRGRLAARADCELDPILLARVGKRLLLVDGHHRHDAYRRAGRHLIPARILDADLETAAAVSKLVNFGSESLPMHPEQARDALWQFTATTTDRGRLALPKGKALEALAARFGASHQTLRTMRARLSTTRDRLREGEFRDGELDPGTGWPRWRVAKRDREWMKGYESIETDERTRMLAEQLAELLWEQRERIGADAYRAGLRLHAEQARDHGDDEAANACVEAANADATDDHEQEF